MIVVARTTWLRTIENVEIMAVVHKDRFPFALLRTMPNRVPLYVEIP